MPTTSLFLQQVDLSTKNSRETNDGGTSCLPLYRYTDSGERVSNITEWGIKRINDHYKKEWGEDFKSIYPDGITPERIFAYTYAVLHDPVYRYDYEIDLLREFPRLPLYHDFDLWAKMGQELLDLHIGFESADPFPLERVDKPGGCKEGGLEGRQGATPGQHNAGRQDHPGRCAAGGLALPAGQLVGPRVGIGPVQGEENLMTPPLRRSSTPIASPTTKEQCVIDLL